MSDQADQPAATPDGAPPPEIDSMMLTDQLRASGFPGEGVHFMEPARRGESMYAAPPPPRDE